MTGATTITTEPWAILEPWPELDAALVRWRLDAELDAYINRERAIDGAVMLALDLGRPVDLDRVIELAS